VERHSVVEGAKAVRCKAKDAMERVVVPLGYLTQQGIIPRHKSFHGWLSAAFTKAWRQWCSCFEAQAWHKQSNPAQQNARYSTHPTVDNERLELMHPVVGPRP
jgi:hypothetical protein